MRWRLRSDVPALAGGALVVLVTGGLPGGWRVGLAVAVAGLLAAGARWREPATSAAGLLLLVGIAAVGDAPGGAVVVALATGAVAVSAAAAGGRPPAPAIDVRTRVVRALPVVAAVLAAAPVALLVAGASPTPSGWAVVGAGVLVAWLLVAAARGGATTDGTRRDPAAVSRSDGPA